MPMLRTAAVLIALVPQWIAVAQADELPTFQLTLTGSSLSPQELHVPAGKPFLIRFTNANSRSAELESNDLKVEKVALGYSDIVVRVRAASPGRYLIVDEYQEAVARAFVVVE